VLRRLLNSFRTQGESTGARSVTGVADLRAGDLITLKSRLSLPLELRDATLEIDRVGTYQFDDGIYMQLTLIATDRSKFHLGYSPSSDSAELCFSKPISHALIGALFDADQFSDLFEEGFSNLSANPETEGFDGWLTRDYAQTKNMAVGYYFDRDMRGEQVSNRQDDDSEEFRYHELRGGDDQYEITVEVWGDGETDVSLDVYCPSDVIETLWPAGQS